MLYGVHLELLITYYTLKIILNFGNLQIIRVVNGHAHMGDIVTQIVKFTIDALFELLFTNCSTRSSIVTWHNRYIFRFGFFRFPVFCSAL
jgi:hypothetical protein